MSNTYFSLASGDLLQDWSNTGLITTNDNWDLVPSIVGFLGDGLTSATGTDPRTITGSAGTIDVIANQLSPGITNGGVAEFQIANATVALQGSGPASAPYLAIYLNATGRQGVTLSFNARDLDASTDNAVQPIAVQYRIGSTGAWIDLPAGYIADASTGPSLATLTTAVTVTLPSSANNQAQVEVRIITTNAVGNDEWIGIDDIAVTSTALVQSQPGALSINDASLVEGNAGAAAITFTVTRSGGSDGAVDATWTVQNGTTSAADFAGPLTGTVHFDAGQTSATITVQIAGDTFVEASETFAVVLSNPTGGATILDGSGAGTIVADDLPPVANVFVNEINYDPVGTDANEFIELAGLAGTDLTGWKLVLYNGNGGGVYGTLNLSGTLADAGSGFGFVKVLAPALQNGAPDGIALVDSIGRVVQFLSYEGAMTATSGVAASMTSTDIGIAQENAAVGFTLQLTGTGSSYADFTWTANVADTAAAVNGGQTFLSGTALGQIRIADARVSEGNAGEALLTFTVSRAGGYATQASVDWQAALGTADGADLGIGAVLAGTVSFAANEFTKTITIPVRGDTLGEVNETLTVTLSNVTGNAVIADGGATGTIVNDDPIALTIMAIQGAGHLSAYAGQPVITTGIVTAVDAGGFYLQDPGGDGNTATSDAIFVYTGIAPGVAVGDAVSVKGTVAEFASGAGLSLTEIDATPANITVTSTGNALPAAMLIGAGGLLPPSQTIDNDGLTSFDPASDGIDFWESLEGMRVTVDSPLVVSNTNQYGETDIVASLGVGSTGVNDRGGITIGAGDFNPEKLQLDDRFGALIGYVPNHTIGDQLASVTGVIGYSFEHYELLATEAVTVTSDVTLTEEVSVLRGDANYMSVATYNLENLDPSDHKYEILSNDIVYNLMAPDIIAVQEMQDADGAGSGTSLSGASNAQGLIDAIYAQSGITYVYVEIAPAVANSTGGEPGGNIRNGYLYRPDRVALLEGSLALVTDPAFNGSRKPLAATWEFNGQTVTTINVHFTSRGGSDPLWGATQPPADAGDAARTAQAAAVGAYVNDRLAADPSGQYMVLGDWNGFYFERAQTQLTDGGVFTNLAMLLDAAERYSYVFDGNHQLIDNMLVTGGLFEGTRYDAVHLNAQFGAEGRPTDHDPQLALLLMGITPHDVVLSNDVVAENQPGGTLVGTLSATDTTGDVLTYTLVDDAGGRFVVDAATGAVTTTAAFDHEATGSFTVTVKVTDSAGLNSTQDIVITVGDVNEAPTAVGDAIAANEDATSANLWSLLQGNDFDPDLGDVLEISAIDTTGTHGSLVFDAASQTLRYVADGDAFDALAPGATAIDTFTYTVRDSGGLTSTASVSVTVTGIADGLEVAGGNGIDWLVGTAGEDQIRGGRGDDRLFGLDGHDWLQGDTGNDLLTGGEGHDSFAFGKSYGDDVVTDFDLAEDRVVLLDGAALRTATFGDYNHDGQIDARLAFTTGGSLTLLGLDSIAGLYVDHAAGFADASANDWYLHLQSAGVTP
ncbi:hypothetical protein B0I00_2209 [Novosphingobium kunmingense]|uniref:Cadherin domain-containing protein n=1 Tax=Novosphingobium kunmingense TaxID=1211806 RepID=A0A2N0H6N2_9SPHN|nr:Calx-beta domain-containing protein [Novosphingobium kunmingense]PKB14611.1 hypothetical protein B0I00_2209 [Novosphingobium kunmingense]